jgi:hypothetical protein
MNNIADRFRAVILANTKEGRRWAELGALTDIPATSWQKAYNGKQRPTTEMIEAIARLWPCYAFWLATGITDAQHGHVSCRDGQVQAFFPERMYALRNAARPYFEHALDMFQRVYGTGRVLLPDGIRQEFEVKLLMLQIARNAEESALAATEVDNLPDELRAAKKALAQIQQENREKRIEMERREERIDEVSKSPPRRGRKEK